MASHLKIVFVTCLLLFILMEEFKPVLAKKNKKLKQRINILETSMAELEAKIKALEECKGKCKHPTRSKAFVLVQEDHSRRSFHFV